MKLVVNTENTSKLIDHDERDALIDDGLTRLFPERRIKRVLFVTPPDVDEGLFVYEVGKRKRSYNYPMYGLGIVASLLRRDDIEVSMINLNNEVLKACINTPLKESFNFNEAWKNPLRKEIDRFKPDIIGITCMFTQAHKSAILVCEEIKRLKTNMPVALGGVHPTNCFISKGQLKQQWNDFSSMDFVFLHEAEQAFKYFVMVINKKARVDGLFQIHLNLGTHKYTFLNNNPPSEEDLNIIPAYDLMNIKEMSCYGVISSFSYFKDKETCFATVHSSRGCRGRCTFCSVSNFNGKGVRQKSVKTIIEELLLLKDRYGVDHIMWLDDDLLFDHKRAEALFKEMKRNKVGITWDCTNGVIAASCTERIIAAAAESGCIGLNIGMETGNPEILKRIKKPGKIKDFYQASKVLKKFPQINSRVYLIIGFPGETYGMLQDTFNVAMEIDLDWYNITILQQLPNTPIFESNVQSGRKDDVDTGEIRYNSGPYGKKREMMRDRNFASFSNPFENVNMEEVIPSTQLEDIWMYMNFHLNFKRLLKLNNPVKLGQQLKYLTYITETVAPDDPLPMYFCGFLQKRVSGVIDPKLLTRLEATVDSSEYWENCFKHFNLSTSQLAS